MRIVSLTLAAALITSPSLARDRLTADKVLELSAADDLQVEVNGAIDRYDLAGHNLTIRLYPKTYLSTLSLPGGIVGRGRFVIDGNGASIEVANGDAINNTGGFGFYIVRNVKLRTVGSGYCLIAQVGGYIVVNEGVELKGCATGGIVSAASGAVIQVGTSLRISGSMPYAFGATSGGALYGTDANTWITVVGTPSISYFALAYGGVLQVLNWRYSGGSSGARCLAAMNGSIVTNGGAPFPGTSACVVYSGGQYN